MKKYLSLLLTCLFALMIFPTYIAKAADESSNVSSVTCHIYSDTGECIKLDDSFIEKQSSSMYGLRNISYVDSYSAIIPTSMFSYGYEYDERLDPSGCVTINLRLGYSYVNGKYLLESVFVSHTSSDLQIEFVNGELSYFCKDGVNASDLQGVLYSPYDSHNYLVRTGFTQFADPSAPRFSVGANTISHIRNINESSTWSVSFDVDIDV